jgi:hypothetical protein
MIDGKWLKRLYYASPAASADFTTSTSSTIPAVETNTLTTTTASKNNSSSCCGLCPVLQQKLQWWENEYMKLQTLTSLRSSGTTLQMALSEKEFFIRTVANLEEENRNQALKIQEMQVRIGELARNNFKLMIELGNNFSSNSDRNIQGTTTTARSNNENEYSSSSTIAMLNDRIKTLTEELEIEKRNQHHYQNNNNGTTTTTSQSNVDDEVLLQHHLAPSKINESTCRARPHFLPQPSVAHYGLAYPSLHQPQIISPLYSTPPMTSWTYRYPQSNLSPLTPTSISTPTPTSECCFSNVPKWKWINNDDARALPQSSSGQLSVFSGASPIQNRFGFFNRNLEGVGGLASSRFHTTTTTSISPIYFPPSPTVINICIS